MKRILVLIVVSLLLLSLVSAVGLTSRVTEDVSDSEDKSGDSNRGSDDSKDDSLDDSNDENNNKANLEDDNEIETEDEECEDWSCTKWSSCIDNMKTRDCAKTSNCSIEQESPRVAKSCEEKERIKVRTRTTECPESCECSGSTIKCILQNGREMTITAGKSGNVIVQVKGENMTTNVTLYKSDDGKVYGIFKNNETKAVRIFPDQIKEKIRERTRVKIENEEIKLEDEGSYQYEAKKDSRLLGFIPIKIEVKAYINPQTGEIIYSKQKWWNFLSKDVEAPLIVGNTCGTVSPDSRDECCKNKGYDFYNVDKVECGFNTSSTG